MLKSKVKIDLVYVFFIGYLLNKMCIGASDVCVETVCIPIVLIALPLAGIYHLLKYVVYDMPKYLFRFRQIVHKDIQPTVLRIKIPVYNESEDPIEVV